jgi:hypothetical protein
MTWIATLHASLEKVDLAGWLPPQVLAAPAAFKAAGAAVILIVPGMLTLCILALVVRRFVLRRRARTPFRVTAGPDRRYSLPRGNAVDPHSSIAPPAPVRPGARLPRPVVEPVLQPSSVASV